MNAKLKAAVAWTLVPFFATSVLCVVLVGWSQQWHTFAERPGLYIVLPLAPILMGLLGLLLHGLGWLPSSKLALREALIIFPGAVLCFATEFAMYREERLRRSDIPATQSDSVLQQLHLFLHTADLVEWIIVYSPYIFLAGVAISHRLFSSRPPLHHAFVCSGLLTILGTLFVARFFWGLELSSAGFGFLAFQVYLCGFTVSTFAASWIFFAWTDHVKARCE